VVNIILYIVLLVIEAFVLVIGLFKWFAPSADDNPYAGPVLTLCAALLLAWTVVRLVRWNKIVRQEAEELVSTVKHDLLLRWQNGTQKVVLTEETLMVDDLQFHFGSWHQKLLGILWGGAGESIGFQIKNSTMGGKSEVIVSVPLEMRDQVNQAVQQLKRRYQI
jgi:hypothetical protein